MAEIKPKKIKIRTRIEELDLPQREKLKAIAIKYDVEKDRAPKVLAVGKGSLAEKILQLAEENRVPMVEDKALTDLLAKLEIFHEIPPDLYTIVAEILAFVYQLNKMAKKREQVQKRYTKSKAPK